MRNQILEGSPAPLNAVRDVLQLRYQMLNARQRWGGISERYSVNRPLNKSALFDRMTLADETVTKS